jgi:hypothetical protein
LRESSRGDTRYTRFFIADLPLVAIGGRKMPEDWKLCWELSQKQLDDARSGAASISAGALVLVVGFASSMLLSDHEVLDLECADGWPKALALGVFLVVVLSMYWLRVAFHYRAALKHLGILRALAGKVSNLASGLDDTSSLAMEFRWRPLGLIGLLAALYLMALLHVEPDCHKDQPTLVKLTEDSRMPLPASATP